MHTPSGTISRGRGAPMPSCMTPEVSGVIPPLPPLPLMPSDQEGSGYVAQSGNFTQEYVQFLDLHNMSKSSLRPMPITTQNNLPHIKLFVGSGNSKDTLGILFLYDTGAALNKGHVQYHLQITKNHPKIVARFEKNDGDNHFYPIKLCGAINHPSDYSAENHDILSAVIEYHTPFRYGDCKQFKLALVLGDFRSVNSISGLLTIFEGEIEPKWKQHTYLLHAFKTTFPMVFQQTKCSSHVQNI